MKIRLNLGLKLLLPHIAGFIVICALFAVSLYSFQRVLGIPRLLTAELEEVFLAGDLQMAVIKTVMPLNDYLIAGADPNEKSNFTELVQITEGLFTKLDAADINHPGERLYLGMAKERFQRVKEIGNELFSIHAPLGNPVAGRLMEEADAVADEAFAELGKFRELAKEEQDETMQKVSAIVSRSKWTFYLIFAVTSFGLAILIVFIPYFVSRPLHKLHLGAELIGKGNLSYRIKIKTRDELQQLAEEFNRMAESLEGFYAGLEKKVAERTAGLEAVTKELSLKKDEAEKNNLELFREREALLNLSSDLENANRQLKLAQEQLVQSAKMAAVGQLASGVAHEINNPLTGVLNNVQLIKMEAESKKDFNLAEFKEILDVVEESALRCKRITQGLLNFSRAAKGPHQPANINEVIEKALILIEHEMRIENIKLIKDFSSELPMVLADPNQLQQVFLDIINNAKWAMQEKKQGELRIKTQASPEHKSVMITFSDTGRGIPPENLTRIFEPFFTTKKVGEGTGLGLSISYGIIKEHNGTIAVESEGKDKGANFRITLPAIT